MVKVAEKLYESINGKDRLSYLALLLIHYDLTVDLDKVASSSVAWIVLAGVILAGLNLTQFLI